MLLKKSKLDLAYENGAPNFIFSGAVLFAGAAIVEQKLPQESPAKFR